MADNQILTPSLQAVASPVDRFVAPRMDNSSSGLAQLARGLSTLNPKLQKVIGTAYERKAEGDFVAGQAAGDQMPSGFNLEQNKDGWRQLISQTRKRDEEQGTNVADQLVGASPHFRMGLVKAKAERLAMGLDDHLARIWEDNVGGVQNLDDPQAVMSWLQEQTEAYNEKMGVSAIDPVMLAETYRPRVMQAQDVLLNKHMGYRSKARVAEYENEYSAGVGMIVNGGGNASSSERDFILRLRGSESSGNNRAHRTNKDGRSYTGGLQFGQDRLNDYMAATGTKFTMAEFNKSDALQEMVALWHVRDIDKMIDENGYLGMGYSRDGLRAVAHLGGKGGLQQFVQTGGRYNPSDELGTSLTAYYAKFASNAAQIEQRATEAISNGVSPTKVNKMTVDAIVAQAIAQDDPALLGVLDQINAGSGPLGNIAWVKKLRAETEDKIEDQRWKEQERERTLETRAREDAARTIKMDGFSAVLADPFADTSELETAAIASGNPSLAKEIHDLSRQLQNETYAVPTNHEAVMALTRDIFLGDRSATDILSEISDGVGINYPSSVAQSLVDDLRVSQDRADWLRDPQVRNWIGNMSAEISDRVEQKDIMSNVIVSGKAVANRAEMEITEELLSYLEENPEATKLQVRKFVREATRTILKQPEYQRSDPFAADPVDTTSAESRVDAPAPEPAPAQDWQQAADVYNARRGTNLTAEEFQAQFGGQ